MSVVKDVTVLAGRIGGIKGVVAVMLFGSYARQEQDEGSDLDLLVLFDSRASLLRALRLLHKRTAEVPAFIQAVAMTVQEFRASWMFQSVVRDGRVLYAQEGFNLWSLARQRLKPYGLVTYDLAPLEPRRKVRFLQDLFGRESGGYEYGGFMGSVGGLRVGRNTVMIPQQHLGKLAGYLEGWGVLWTQRQVWST